LGTDHVDLYLIHWPRPRDDRYVDTWRGLEKAAAEGKTRAIGVSNFTVEHLSRLVAETETVPAVNQIELHPRFTQSELRDYHAEGSFVAYVPPGSVKKGEALANSGSKVTRCSVCHGSDLQGMGPVPGIAGRSPSYIARQLHDMQSGTRKGPWVILMQPVVDKMTGDDILNVTAYVSSLPVGTKAAH